MNRPNTLLADTRSTVARWTEWSIGKTFSDSYGDYAFIAKRNDRTFLCVCKKSLHANLASFMRKVVGRARGEGYILIEFIGETPSLGNAYAFDPETVYAHGQPSVGDSAKGVRTDWLELDADEFGVILGEYVSGRASLRAVEETPTGQTTLADGGFCNGGVR